MRLLHFDQEKLVLSDFRGKIIPQYAILSHRWGDSEVLFEDLGRGTYQKKVGYRKVEFCAAQAARDGLQYFWIDTCCINKWDLRELSKAINLMFRWYKDAARCYVFLPDVSAAADTPQYLWEASFRKSEWFTRGWTLQELIAPVSVEFFSCEGRRLGDKSSLEPLVYEITGIPLQVLRNGPLDQFTIAERREWVKNRKTTEEEDAVYCLLGILNIVIPTAYGEGVDKAWRRLQTELDAVGSAPSIIPFSQSERFIGQELQLNLMEAMLYQNNQATKIAIVGPPGTGKSQLALEFAHRTRQRSKNWSIFWIDASDTDSLYRSYASIAQKLDISGWDNDEANSRQLVQVYLTRTREQPCLFVFDNIEDASTMSSGTSIRATDLDDHLPQSELCSIIFTTANSSNISKLKAQEVVELEKMAPNTARRMLENYLDIPLSRSEQQEAQILLQELSHLPLAIVQAAAYIKTTSISVQEYRLLVDGRKNAFRKCRSKYSEDRTQEHDTTGPVGTTLLISLDRLCKENTLAAEYLFLAACVDRKDIPLDFMRASSPREKEDAIKVLNSYALVTRRPAESSFDLHQKVHYGLRAWLRSESLLEQWVKSALREVLRVFPDQDHGSRSKWRRLLPHAKYLLSHAPAEQESRDLLNLAWKCAMALYNDGRWKEAEKLFMQVAETRKRMLGDEHPDTLTSMARLASTYRSQGRWIEAQQLEVHVMETRKRVLGDEHPDMLASMVNLALTYRSLGQWKKSEQLQLKELEICSSVRGNKHPSTLISMSNLASTYRKQGRWKKAEQLEVQVMETRTAVFGDEHPDTLVSMANLASTYKYQGRWKKAEELNVRAMETRKRVLGEDHPHTLTSMADIASTYRYQGRWTEAEQLEVQVMEMRKMTLGNEHPDTLASMADLAVTFWNQGRWNEAEQLEVPVMETRKRVFGEEHPNTLTSMANLAGTYMHQGRWVEAEELQRREFELSLRVRGDEHPSTLTSMANLGVIYSKQGKEDKAELLHKQAMERRIRTLGNEHPDTLASIANLASTYSNQGRWSEAQQLEVQVLETNSRVLGEKHPNSLTSLSNLAFTLKRQGLYDEAIPLLEQCYRLREKVLGSEHPDTVSSLQSLQAWRIMNASQQAT